MDSVIVYLIIFSLIVFFFYKIFVGRPQDDFEKRNRKLVGVYSIFFLLISNFLTFFFIKDFSLENFILFFVLFLVQNIYPDYRSVLITFISFIVWLFCYYIYVYDLGIYYTSEQTFTDSNYYDYYALKFSDLPISRIIIESKITWQSTFVITFYSIVYKIFGATLLNPVVINLILIHLTFYNLKIRNVDQKYLIYVYALIPFMALNLVVPGKDVIMIFLLSIYASTFLNKNSSKKTLLIKIIVLVIGYYNRPNTLPIYLILEMIYFNKLNKKVKFLFVLIFLFILPFYSESLFASLGFADSLEKQREGFLMSEQLRDILLPTDGLLFIIVTPFRLLLYLVSPFPIINNVIESYNNTNFFTFWFVLFKFISGFLWFMFMIKFLISKKLKYNPVINSLISVSVLISTVYLVQGGRYRVFCDFLMILYFVYDSIKTKSSAISLNNN